MSGLVLGIDAGGTRTRARVEDAGGRLVFEGEAGPANLARSEPAAWQREVLRAIRGAPPGLAAVTGGFAGLLTPRQTREVETFLRSESGAPLVRAVPDYALPLAAAPPEAACVVVLGTGSVVVSRRRSGWRKSGGGGPLLGDEGSGYDLGRWALRIVALRDEAKPSPALAAALKAVTGAGSAPGWVLGAARGAPMDRLAHAVLEDARQGVAYAQAAVRASFAGLAKVTVSHLRRWKPPGRDLVLTGGLTEFGPEVLEWFSAAFKEETLHVDGAKLPRTAYQVSRLADPPVVGAVRLAWELIHGN